MQAISVLAGIYGGNVCRVCIHPDDNTEFPPAIALTDTTDPAFQESISYEAMPAQRDAQGMILCRRKSLKLIYDPPTGNFSLLNNKGEILRGEIQTGKFGAARILLRTKPGAKIYGIGAATGKADRGASDFRLMNLDTLFYTIPRTSYSSFPFFLIQRPENAEGGSGYIGVHWNSSLPADITTPHENADRSDDLDGIHIQPIGIESDSAISVDLFVYTGTPAEILERFTALTGRSYIPPLWSLGFHQSRWSYKTADRVMTLARRFRDQEVPCDAIHIDIDYMDRYRVFTWNQKQFPDPKGLHQALERLGFRTVLFNDPGVAQAEYSVYTDGLEKNVFCQREGGGVYIGKAWPGLCAFPDFDRPQVRKWWAEQHAPLLDAGVGGLCNDMNDPVLVIGKKYNPFEEKIVHDGKPHGERRNAYAAEQARATVDAFRKWTPRKRPFVISRSGSIGMQQYSALWTGDNHSTWSHLRENLHMVVNLGLSGMAFTGADVGGFASGFFPGVYKVIKLRKQPELFARWMELGALMPFFRAHTALHSFDQEPWSFGEETLNIARKHIRRRYRLLPYLYRLFWECHETGAPIVRPLFFEYPELRGEQLAATREQFLLGPDLLAAPALYRGQKQVAVYLPAGEWYDFETGRRYVGQAHYRFDTRPGVYPLFVRAGSVLPVCGAAENAETSMEAGIALEIYPAAGQKLSGRLRLDDGHSNAVFEKEQYTEQSYSGTTDRNGNVSLVVETGHRKYTPPVSKLTLRFPPGYRTMKLEEKQHEARQLDLVREDRLYSVSTFELPVGAADSKRTAEFEFRADWA